MKKYVFITTLLAISSLLLSGCMTTWPIVNDLDHYQKWDTYESIREKNEEGIVDKGEIEENVEENFDEEEIESIEEAENTEEDMEVKE